MFVPNATAIWFNAVTTSRLDAVNTVPLVVRLVPNANVPPITVLPVDEATVNLSTAEPFCILKFLDAPFKV